MVGAGAGAGPGCRRRVASKLGEGGLEWRGRVEGGAASDAAATGQGRWGGGEGGKERARARVARSPSA